MSSTGARRISVSFLLFGVLKYAVYIQTNRKTERNFKSIFFMITNRKTLLTLLTCAL